METETRTTTAVHFMGNAHVQRTACGRYVGVTSATKWSADQSAVTCKRCQQAVAPTEQPDWQSAFGGVTYGPITPAAPQRKRERDPYCRECGLSLDSRYGGHHPGCPSGPVA